MKIAYLVASVVAAVLAATSLVAATGGGTQVTHLRGNDDYTQGCSADYNNCFWAQSYDDDNGVRQGKVDVWSIDSEIFCLGPAYGSAVFVQRSVGYATVSATLDPASSDCTYFHNVGSPLTVSLTGQPDGVSSEHNNGTGNATYEGTNYQYTIQEDAYSETFTGTTGLADGPFFGSAEAQHRTELHQAK